VTNIRDFILRTPIAPQEASSDRAPPRNRIISRHITHAGLDSCAQDGPRQGPCPCYRADTKTRIAAHFRISPHRLTGGRVRQSIPIRQERREVDGCVRGATPCHLRPPPDASRGGWRHQAPSMGSSAPTLILPFFPGLLTPHGDIISTVAGYQSSYQSLRFFGGLHDADIDEILGMDPVAVYRYQARAQARLWPWLSR
jgi:hypothetical protein